MKEAFYFAYLKLKFAAKGKQLFLCLVAGGFILQFGSLAESQAQEGAQIFQNAACTLLDSVLADNFGAMITVLAGALAILASVMGSFKGAWALLFVSVGSFIFGKLVEVFFPNLNC